MTAALTLRLATALAGALICSSTAFAAAAPDVAEPAPPKAAPRAIAPLEFQLGTEVVVRDWVLCVSQAFAEAIVRARAESVEQALAAYADLKAAKSCGQFPELRVILRESVFATEAANDARVFSASVNIAGRWANAFVVKGGLPADR